MKALAAVLWLTALSAAASEAEVGDSSRLPSRTELETVSRRDLISLGRNSIGSSVIDFKSIKFDFLHL